MNFTDFTNDEKQQETDNNNNNNTDEAEFDVWKALESKFSMKEGQPIKNGGHIQQYAPKSIGGFATSSTAVHDVQALSNGDSVVHIGIVSSSAFSRQIPTKNQNQSSEQETKQLELVAEEDEDDDEEYDENNNQNQNQQNTIMKLLKSHLGRNAGIIKQCDPKTIKFQVCGSSGEIVTKPRNEFRGATEGETKEIQRIIQIRQQQQQQILPPTTTTKLSGNIHSRDGQIHHPVTSSSSSTATNNSTTKKENEIKLFAQLFVNLKDSGTTTTNVGEDDDNNNTNGPLMIKRVLEETNKVELSSGDLVEFSQVEIVQPKMKKKAIVVILDSSSTSSISGEGGDIEVGNLVSVEKIDRVTKTATVKKIPEGKMVSGIPLKCLCATVRMS